MKARYHVDVAEEQWLYVRFERDTRYYELRIQQDIFGYWVLIKIWGRRGSALGHMGTYAFESRAAAASQWQLGLQTRLKRGYIEIRTHSSDADDSQTD